MWSVSYILGLDITQPVLLFIFLRLTHTKKKKKNQGQNIYIQKPTGTPEQNFSSLPRGELVIWYTALFLFLNYKKFFFGEKKIWNNFLPTKVRDWKNFIHRCRMCFNVNSFWIFIILSRDDIVVRSTGFLVREFCVCYTGRGLLVYFACYIVGLPVLTSDSQFLFSCVPSDIFIEYFKLLFWFYKCF